MAHGAIELSGASVAVAITGVAGPEPDEDGNPVGLVCMAIAGELGRPACWRSEYPDRGREGILNAAMRDVLDKLADYLRQASTAKELGFH